MASSEPPRGLSTGQLARQHGCSVQQVRRLEQLGVIPAATRAPNGYRVFTDRHALALRTYGRLSSAIGPVAAAPLLRELPAMPRGAALARVNDLHVTLARQRTRLLSAQRALLLIADEGPVPGSADDAMSITQLAEALGVRTSALRHWEREALMRSERVGSLAARSYPPPMVHRARVVAALRQAGQPLPRIRSTLAEVDDLGDTAGPARSLADHLQRTEAQIHDLLLAGPDLVAMIGDHGPGPGTDA